MRLLLGGLHLGLDYDVIDFDRRACRTKEVHDGQGLSSENAKYTRSSVGNRIKSQRRVTFEMKVHHIGLAVENIDQAAHQWEQLGFKIEHRETVESQSVEVAFLPLGNIWLEFIQPAAENTPITNFLKKRGEGLHHICLQVDDIEKETGSVKLITDPVKGFGDSTIAFAYPQEFGKVLVEFVQNPPY